MSIKIGDVDIFNQALENELRIGVLERIVEFLINNNGLMVRPDQQQIEKIREETLQALKKKYPNSGIELKKK